MKLNNFVLTETKGFNPLNWEFIDYVDVTTGVLWWKKTEHRQIRRKYAGNWFFADTGDFTPDFQAEKLARAWSAKTGEQT